MNRKTLMLCAALCVCYGVSRAQYCTNDSRYTEASYFDSTQITVGANIQYGIALDVQGNPDTLLMDIYYPNLNVDPSAKRPFIMLIHGGGFSTGDKQSGDIRDLCVHLAMRGFVCASINYRLGHDFSEYGQFKARYRAIQDAHAALRFVVNNANTVRADTSWLFVGGQSAGALTALGMVYADQTELDDIGLLYDPATLSVELGNLQTSGNSLTDTYTIKGIFNNWGGIVASEVDVDEMIPTVSFHGELDPLVPIGADDSFANYTLNGSLALHSDLTANGICSELTVDPTGEHGIYRNASSVFRAARASCFFKSVFCNDCNSLYTTDSIPPDCSIALSAEDNGPASAFKVYPNPFKDSFHVDGLNGRVDLVIYNCFGQVVHRAETSSGAVETDLMPGIYLLHVKHAASGRAFTARLIRD